MTHEHNDLPVEVDHDGPAKPLMQGSDTPGSSTYLGWLDELLSGSVTGGEEAHTWTFTPGDTLDAAISDARLYFGDAENFHPIRTHVLPTITLEFTTNWIDALLIARVFGVPLRSITDEWHGFLLGTHRNARRANRQRRLALMGRN